ncbi:Trp biosynthesis-associated membrane protein [Aquipuribacter nitratireducens]|uniref:Trp biosynthesis-associated membrane protein n=1 Tax=Aquipuribacter nitratireducens TaxID=650104 RepID=A0ABW0GS14_9MICO
MRPAPLSAAAAVAALLALATLGLTWVRRSTAGPLGEAGAATTESLTGREVSPLTAALVPAVLGLAVVALLLPGRWRLVGLVPAGLAAVGAGLGAAVAAAAADGGRTGAPEVGVEVTPVPWLAVAACVLVVLLAGAAAVAAWRPVVPAAPPTRAAPTAAPGHAPEAAPDERALWDALDAGEDPTAPPSTRP